MTAEPDDIQRAHLRLVELRREAAQLLALIDTSELPEPTERLGTANMRGPMWVIGNPERRHWSIHVLNDSEHRDAVFIHSPSDLMGSCDELTGDTTSLRIENARRLAMAILAACAWLDEHRCSQVVE